jgi:hypothetical protein
MSKLWIRGSILVLFFSYTVDMTLGAEPHPRYPDKLFFTMNGVHKFDQREWLNNSFRQSAKRVDMFFDLVHTKPLIGMTRAEIHSLLGRPELDIVSMLKDELETSDFDPYELCSRTYFSLKYSKDRVVSLRIDTITTSDKHLRNRLISASSGEYTKNF